MKMNEDCIRYTESTEQEALDLLAELAKIPAPSWHEEKRAEFCKAWLEKQGAKGVYIDEALNVIYPIGVTEDNPIVVFVAHSDVVFPDTEELPLKVEDGRMYCPGIGDDTADVVAMLYAAKYVTEKKLIPKELGVLLVVNTGEEGLGNLHGCRQIMKDFGARTKEFFTFDASNGHIADTCVGSKRFSIEITTEGGHSFGRFGNRNAIYYLSKLITDLYAVKVPEGGKTTFNVGIIKGGTSVNTIAQQAEMLYEFRSDRRENLAYMQEHLDAALAFYRTKGIGVKCELIGDRPCMGDVNPDDQKRLADQAGDLVRRYFDCEPEYSPGSTDCNIPLSMGIPAVSVGCYFGAGAHTRGEYVEIDSLIKGRKLALDLILQYFQD